MAKTRLSSISPPQLHNKPWKVLAIMTTFIAAISAATFAPAAQAAAPGDPGHYPTTPITGIYKPYQDPHWLYMKLHHCLRSGVTRGMRKGAKVTPYGVSCSSSSSTSSVVPNTSGVPASYSLDYSKVQGVYEPSNGQYPNNGSGTADTDSSGLYYLDGDFYDLCGPGSADIALEYWPAPPNLLSVTNIDDTSYFDVLGSHERTNWNSNRYRGYMTYLAWETNWPWNENSTVGTPWHDTGGANKISTGMMDYSNYTSKGVTLYGMAAALNWEASGNNGSTWLNYFYVIAWISQNNDHNLLHQDIVSDTYSSNVPVVAEVDADYLPNWKGDTKNPHHLISIIGYNDTTDQYEYTDTCGSTTACNEHGGNGDNSQPYWVNQGTMWNAITAITEDQRTGSTEGDGGWVW